MNTNQPGAEVTKKQRLLPRWSRRLMTGVLLALLPACSSVKMKSSRTAATNTAGPFRRVLVVGIDDRPLVREGFENDLVAFLNKRSVSGTSSYSRFPLEQMKGDKGQVRERLAATGADSVLFVRVTDRADVADGPPASLGDIDMAAVDELRYNAFTTPGGAMNNVFKFQARLYRISDANPVWDAQVEAVMKEDTDSILLMRKVAGKIVAQLGRDRVIP